MLSGMVSNIINSNLGTFCKFTSVRDKLHIQQLDITYNVIVPNFHANISHHFVVVRVSCFVCSDPPF